MKKNMDHSKIIKSVRKATELNQEGLARVLGTSQKTVSEWSTGIKSINVQFWPILIVLDKKLTGKDFMGDGFTRKELLKLLFTEEFLGDSSDEDG
jgi:transcriptional regulator with XRE-family HTH domain